MSITSSLAETVRSSSISDDDSQDVITGEFLKITLAGFTVHKASYLALEEGRKGSV